MPRSLLALILLLPLASLAQSNDASQKLLSKFSSYAASHPTEKVYLHLDRPYYAAGDTIYYKAYVTLPGTNELSGLSGVLHVALIDKLNGKPLYTEKLKITNGVAWGDFSLPDTLANGSYTIRAYTNLMRNNGSADIFNQDIPVVNVKPAKKVPVAANTASMKSPVIQFFPEGGTLIAGISSKVAFKAINLTGLGIAVKGLVTDNDNKQVCSFASSHQGMGAFSFRPEKGKSYKAAVIYANGTHDIISLPGATDEGITLSAENDSMLVVPVAINASEGYFKENKGQVFILGVYNNGVLTNIPCRLDSLSLQAYLYKRKLHTGITRLTLFSPAGDPLCERLLFINNNDQLKVDVGSDMPAYGKRQKVTVSISAKNIKDMPVKGDFSVSVTDENKAPADTNAESTIVNYLLLSSELKGNIEQPNYYFNQRTAEAQADLDNLMLTQGYRSFEWKAILNNTDTIPKYYAERSLSLKGSIKNLQGKIVPNAQISLGVIKPVIAKDTIADASGEFTFNNLFITDTARILLRAGKGNKNWAADVEKDYAPPIIPATPIDTSLMASAVNPQIAAAMKKQYEQYGNIHTGILLKQVNIKENKNPLHITQLLHSDNLNGPGMADQVIMGDQLTGCGQVVDCLVSILRGVKFVYGGFTPTIYNMRSVSSIMGRAKPMAVMLNGIIMGQDALAEISPEDVYSIEVLRDPVYLTIYGSQATAGLLVITTKNGTEPRLIKIQPGLTTYLFHGFYKFRQFYSPVYDVKTPDEQKPDVRTTVFWKPVLLTDEAGNATFDFYTADNAANYRVVIEGIDAAGNIGRAVYHCRVQ